VTGFTDKVLCMPLHLGTKCTTIVYYPVCLPSTHHTQIWLRHNKGEVASSGMLKPNFKKSGLFQHCRAEHTLTSCWSNKPMFISLYKGNKDRKKQDTAYPSSSFSICDIFSIRWDENFCVSKVSFGSK